MCFIMLGHHVNEVRMTNFLFKNWENAVSMMQTLFEHPMDLLKQNTYIWHMSV